MGKFIANNIFPQTTDVAMLLSIVGNRKGAHAPVSHGQGEKRGHRDTGLSMVRTQ